MSTHLNTPTHSWWKKTERIIIRHSKNSKTPGFVWETWVKCGMKKKKDRNYWPFVNTWPHLRYFSLVRLMTSVLFTFTVLCLSSFCVLCQCLWMVYSWLPLWFWLTSINMKTVTLIHRIHGITFNMTLILFVYILFCCFSLSYLARHLYITIVNIALTWFSETVRVSLIITVICFAEIILCFQVNKTFKCTCSKVFFPGSFLL